MAFVCGVHLNASRIRVSHSCTRKTAYVARRASRAAQMTAPVSSTATLEGFISDASTLGTIRFINISGGAVLETIGRFDYGTKVFEVPDQGKYLTLANDDKTFECHMNLAKISRVTMSKEKAKMGDHDLYVIRLRDSDDKLILSCVLMWDPSQGPGNYLHGAVDAFTELQSKYGETFEVTADV